MTRPTWSTKGRFIGLRVRNVGGTRERIARSGPISTFDTHIIICCKGQKYQITCLHVDLRLYDTPDYPQYSQLSLYSS